MNEGSQLNKRSQMNKGPQLNKESGVSDEQGASAERLELTITALGTGETKLIAGEKKCLLG